ncbi:MAG: helix-turn-helix domain-containing protein [Candidatus Sericytochromatia bacterium]
MSESAMLADPVYLDFADGHFEKVYRLLSRWQREALFARDYLPVLLVWSARWVTDRLTVQRLIDALKQAPEYHEDSLLAAYLQSAEALALYHQSASTLAVDQLNQGAANWPHPLFQIALALLNYKVCLNQLAYDQALEHLLGALKYLEQIHWHDLHRRTLLNLAQLYFLKLDLKLSLHYFEVFLRLHQAAAEVSAQEQLDAFLILIQIHYVTHNLDAYASVCEQFEALLQDTQAIESLRSVFLYLEILINGGHLERAENLARLLEVQAQQTHHLPLLRELTTVFQPLLVLKRAILYGDTLQLQGLCTSAASLAGSSQKPVQRYFSAMYQYVLCYYSGDYRAAQAHLQNLTADVSLPASSTLQLVYLNHLAAVLYALEEDQQALEIMKSLLYRIQDTGYVRLLTDYLGPDISLLTLAVARCQASAQALSLDFLARLEEVLNKPGLFAGPSLSRQELKVLRLLAEHSSNRQIAAQLFISENTVKFHLKNIYAKLEVKERRCALEKARLLL